MHYRVIPSALTGGDISVPGDKSISHRALMLTSIADGRSKISGFLAGEDCLCTLAALRALGVRIDTESESVLTVHGVGLHGFSEPAGPLDMGNSGTAMRLFAGLLSGQAFDSCLTGDESLSRRPMNRVIEPLQAMGAKMTSENGKPPLRLYGEQQLQPVHYALPVASAQVKSAILLAGLFADGRTSVTEPAVTRDHTERMLESMGVSVEVTDGCIGIVGQQTLRATDIVVPADLSSAAFPVLAAIVGQNVEVIVRGVGVNPTRTGFIDVLRQMGASIELENTDLCGAEPIADLRVRSSTLKGIDVDPDVVSLAIDEFPLLFVAAALAKGSTSFRGIGELRVKESDRIAAMASGLRTLGIEVSETPDGAVVHGGKLAGGTIDSFGDHRIAMAFAVAGTVASAPLNILNTAAVTTSFPGFVGCMQSIGARIEIADAVAL
ncbi:MAG: 3-phosphoshikimate 1-carboxyvinyltransferase [Gammaproteobacteria bacterium]|nr:3-phosphoshikimate 1-carboxyvinyltransferase [Gammaproteobacteria bacterium]MDH4315785.1 3-phosphoshikimate 1-carboxyvinyltransferase [Gammaproteobacteria bacterium]MDH5214723.1 3-phosphoshikimate 1-carboxyvinyltransferase [Gammaproteobacteria bacterium]